MTALTADRNTPERAGDEFQYPMAAAKKIFAGSMVFLDTSGNAEPATEATGKIAVGRAEEYKDNTNGAAAAETIKVKAGTFRWVNGETITKAHIGDTAYMNDDQTVYRTSTGRSPCGVIVDVDSLGVWVATKPPTSISTVGLLAANNLSDLGSAATARSNLGVLTRSIGFRATNLVGTTRYGFQSPVAGVISKIRTVLLGAALATGNATLTAKINTVAVTNGVVTITEAGSAIGDLDTATPTAARTVAVGDFVEVLVGGTNSEAAAFAEVIFEIDV